MLPGEAFLFSEGREALLLGGTTSVELTHSRTIEHTVLPLPLVIFPE